MKGAPAAFDMNEVRKYNVSDGKIVKEEFFHTPPTHTKGLTAQYE